MRGSREALYSSRSSAGRKKFQENSSRRSKEKERWAVSCPERSPKHRASKLHGGNSHHHRESCADN